MQQILHISGQCVSIDTRLNSIILESYEKLLYSIYWIKDSEEFEVTQDPI